MDGAVCVRTKDELESFKVKMDGVASSIELERFLEGYSFYGNYRKALNCYFSIHSSGSVFSENDFYNLRLSSTESTLIALSLKKFFSFEIRFEEFGSCGNVHVGHGVIDKDGAGKYQYLRSVVADLEMIVGSTFFSRGASMRCKKNGVIFYIVSIKSPVDGVYCPAEGKVYFDFGGLVRASEILYVIERYLTFYVRERRMFDTLFRAECLLKNVVQVARVDRPYHVLADEMSGNFYLRESLGEEVPLVFSGEASFFEGEDVYNETDLYSYGMANVLFCSQRRLDFVSEAGSRFLNGLHDKSMSLYGVGGSFFQDFFKDKVVVWIAVTGGEKPRLKNELDFISALIMLFEGRFSNCYYIFDGFTGVGIDGGKGSGVIAYHDKVVRDLVAGANISSKYMSLVGKRIYSKFFYSKFANYVFSSGSPLIWSANANKNVECIVHGGEKMLSLVRAYTKAERLTILGDEFKSWEDRSEGVRFDRVSYLLDINKTLGCIERLIGK